MQGGKSPTVKQQAWQDWQRARGCCNCGATASIHHCVGSSAKHDKVHIGQWFTIALCYDCHQGDHGIHHDMKAFTEQVCSRKALEKHFFSIDDAGYREEAGDNIVPEDAYNAIMDYHR